MSQSARRSDTPSPGDRSRRLILDRTAELLVQRGYGATSLRDIAQHCGMKAGSLYYHFDGKDALVETVMTEGVNRVADEVRKAVESAPDRTALERVRLAMRAHLTSVHDRSDYSSAHIRCIAHVPPEIRQRLRTARIAYERIWAEQLEAAQNAGEIAEGLDLDALRHALIGMLNGTLEHGLVARIGAEETADRFFSFAFDGAGTSKTPGAAR